MTERLEKDNEITVLRRHVGDAWRFNEKGEVEIDNGRVGVENIAKSSVLRLRRFTSTPSLAPRRRSRGRRARAVDLKWR